MSANKGSLLEQRLEFLVITKNPDLLRAGEEVVSHFGLQAASAESAEVLSSEVRYGGSPQMVLVGMESESAMPEKMKMLRMLRNYFPRTQLVAVVQGGESIEDCEFLRGAGAQHLILFQEIRNSSKLYYLTALLVQGTFLPIPVSDLFPSTQLNFNAYQKLTLNRKFLPVAFSGFVFSDKKFRRLESERQIYVRRETLHEYRQYIETYNDRTGSSLKKRCRVLMMELLGLYAELTLLLVLDSEAGRKDLLQSRMEQFTRSSLLLQEYLKECADAWNVIARALDFQFCRHERGVFTLAYALYLAPAVGVERLEDLVLTVLFADLGILDLPQEIYKNLKSQGEKRLSPEELERYKEHPVASLNRILFRQLEVPLAVRSAVVCTHERNDQRGFPNQVPAEKIPVEAKLVLFCEILDRRAQACLEDGMVTHEFVRKQVLQEERSSLQNFDAGFLDKIEELLVA